MDNIEKLLSIARYLDLSDIETELSNIQEKQQQEDPSLILPLVGEYSSGKTTLINALMEGYKLETAQKRTTATIYEVHFGADSCRASILTAENKQVEYNEIVTLKNEDLASAKVVTIFDTSTKVPSATILVDTPGLSSPDAKHKQTLIDFLPQADAILLVVDINSQLTRSLTEFVEMMKLSRKPLFLILTKAEQKSPSDIEDTKHYLGENCQIPIKRVAVVSAQNGNLNELFSLFKNIQSSKKELLSQVNNQRVNSLATRIESHIDDLMKASSSDKEIDESICALQSELNRINREVSYMIDSVSDDIHEKERFVARRFEDTAQSKLNALVGSKSSNFDGEAVSMINGTSSLLLSEYKDSVYQILKNVTRSHSILGPSLFSDMNIDSLSVSNLSYTLELNNMGHEYDAIIKTGIIAAIEIAAQAEGVEGVSRIIAPGNGLIESVIGLATDNLISKPQRVRAVRVYVESTLAPGFRSSLQEVSKQVIDEVRNVIISESKSIIDQKKTLLSQLKKDRQEKIDLFNEKISRLNEFKAFLSTINN